MIQSRLPDNTLFRQSALVIIAILLGIIGGLAIVASNPLLPFMALLGLLALPFLITRPMLDLLLVVATITLLPFAASPVRLAVLTPTLLEIALLLLYAAWLLRLLLNPGEGLRRTPIDLWLLLFLGSTLFASVLGLGRDSSTDVIHNYIKLLLAIGIFFAATNIIRTPRHIETVLRAVIWSGSAAAALALLLWRLPDTLAENLLTRLSIIGYPTTRVVRYVEENPLLGERAIGTQVDPNSLGGLMVIIAALTGAQLLSRRPLLPRWLLAGMFLAEAAAILLTQSRSAMFGLLAAGIFVATLRYRHLWAWGVAGGILIALLGVGSGYLARVEAGLRFQDAANVMRLAEYRNALDIISRYPAFGVGFGTAGELDLTTGVSSVYLTIAERAGLIALALFTITIIVFFNRVLPAIRASRKRAPPRGDPSERGWSLLDSVLLGGAASVLGVLVVNLVDHFYFNIEFPHMSALLWLTVALTLSAASTNRESAVEAASSE
jgi:polysaccharide biosynthesis protein PslJ